VDQLDFEAAEVHLRSAVLQIAARALQQPSGAYHEPDLVSQVVIRRMRKAGINEASFHTLRHTHASNLLSRGVPLPAVSARLGHSDTNVTARVYSHALPADDQRAADTWDAIIKGPVQ